MKKTFMLFAVLLPLLAGCSKKEQAGSAAGRTGLTVEQIRERGTLKVGISLFAPWSMVGRDQELFGFEVDVAEKLAEDTGVELQLFETQWDGIIPALNTGQFDVIISGMTITEERKLSVDFTDPYEYYGMSVALNRELVPEEPSSFADLNRSGIIVAIRSGINEEFVRDNLPDATVRQFTKEEEVVLELLNGNAHAIIAGAPLPAFTAYDNPDKVYVPAWDSDLTRDPAGMTVKKGNDDFLAYLNGWIAENWENGFLQERFDYWFTTRDWEERL